MSRALTFASFSENMNIKRVMRIFYSLSDYSTCHFLCSSKIFLHLLKACPKQVYMSISKRAIKDGTNQISYLFFQKYFLPNLKVLAYNFSQFLSSFFFLLAKGTSYQIKIQVKERYWHINLLVLVQNLQTTYSLKINISRFFLCSQIFSQIAK